MLSNKDRAHISMYNLEAFSKLNMRGEQRYHAIDFSTNDRLIGTLAGVIDGTTFVSGYSAGFGGPDFVRHKEQLEPIRHMLDYCVDSLKAIGIRKLIIRAKPTHYSASEPYLHFALLQRGFSITDGNLNFFVDLSKFKSIEDYVQAIKPTARAMLKPILKLNYQWICANNEAERKTAYETLDNNRKLTGASDLSLTYDYLSQLQETFPNHVHFYLMKINDAVVAASLMFQISCRQSQLMYWGDCARDTYPGVMNLVAYHTIHTGLEKKQDAIDLGPSASFKKNNYGAIAFKTNIGGQPNMRHTYTLSW